MRVFRLCALVVGLGVGLAGGAAHAADGVPGGEGAATAPRAGAVAPAAVGQAAASAAAGQAGPPSVREDFDGDGHQDLATAAPDAAVSGQPGAGYVVVTYGSADGLDPASSTHISQDTPGVPGTAEAEDRFGAQLVARDLDGDGLTDLAVGSSGEAVAGTGSRGTVTVLWGQDGGLGGTGAAVIEAPEGSEGWRVGDDLAGGDFDGDGRADLFMAHGDNWEFRSVLSGPFTRDGVSAGEQRIDMFSTDNFISAVAAGDMTGDGIDDLATFYSWQDHAEGGKFWRGTGSGLDPSPAPLDSAATAAVGDFDGDGKGDLAVRTVPGDINENLPYDPGTVEVRYGTAEGPSDSRVTTLTQDTAGVPGTSEEGDQFGARLDAGDVNGDGYADLAAGVPFEAIGTEQAAGAVVLLKGRAGGLSGAGAQAFHQDTAGVPGVAEAGDRFGGAVHLLDFDGDERDELAVSAPEENGTGAVWSLRGTASGLTADGSLAFNPVDLGLPAEGARFGGGFANENGTSLYPPF